MSDGRAVVGDACRACGRCVEVCPQDAIEITIADPQFVQQTIGHISPLVDVS
jgi:ferredoxin